MIERGPSFHLNGRPLTDRLIITGLHDNKKAMREALLHAVDYVFTHVRHIEKQLRRRVDPIFLLASTEFHINVSMGGDYHHYTRGGSNSNSSRDCHCPQLGLPTALSLVSLMMRQLLPPTTMAIGNLTAAGDVVGEIATPPPTTTTITTACTLMKLGVETVLVPRGMEEKLQGGTNGGSGEKMRLVGVDSFMSCLLPTFGSHHQ